MKYIFRQFYFHWSVSLRSVWWVVVECLEGKHHGEFYFCPCEFFSERDVEIGYKHIYTSDALKRKTTEYRKVIYLLAAST